MPVTTEVRKKTRNTSKQRSDDSKQRAEYLVRCAFIKVRSYQAESGTGTAKTVLCLCRIGAAFNDLKTQVPHGDWRKKVKAEFGYHEDTVSRLMNLAGSWLPEKIPTLGRVLKARLSTDVQKLATLIRLPKRACVQILNEFDLSAISRERFRAVVDERLGEGDLKDGKSKKRQSKSSAIQMTEATQSNASPIEQLFTICKQPMADLTASVQEQLDGDKVDQDSVKEAAAAVDHALDCLNKLKKAIKEKLAA